MKAITLFILLLSTLLLTLPAEARGWGHNGHHNSHHNGHGYRHHGGYRPVRFGHHHHYRHYRQHDRAYRYVGAGLVLGAIVHEAFRPRPVVTRIIERRVLQPTVDVAPTVSAPAPIQRPPVYLRRDRDGQCWLVEEDAEGEIITPQEPEVCG